MKPPGNRPGADGLATRARELIDTILYLTLATIDDDGTPRVSPLYFTPHEYADLYWVSHPEARHSRNIAHDPRTMAVVFDSTVAVGAAEAVYLTGLAHEVPEDELADRCAVAFTGRGGAKLIPPDDLTGDAPLRLFVLHVRNAETLVSAKHPSLGAGRDRRIPVQLA